MLNGSIKDCKKICSLLLVFTLILSVLSSLSVSAADAAESIVNNFDDDAEYTTGTWWTFHQQYLKRNGKTIGQNGITREETTDANGNPTNSAKFTCAQQWKYSTPSAIAVYDPNGNDWYKTAAGVKYNISFKYKIQNAWEEANTVELILKKGDFSKYSSGSTVIKMTGSNPLKRTDALNQWVTLSGSFTASDDSNLWITATTNASNDTTVEWGININVFIDDITLTPEPPVICHVYNGKDVKLVRTETFGELVKPVRSGYVFKGFYLDANKTVPAEDSAAIGTVSELWTKWEAAAATEAIVNNYDEENISYTDGSVYEVNRKINGILSTTPRIFAGGAHVENTSDAEGDQTKALRFVKCRDRNARYGNQFWIYDNTSPDYRIFKPKANTKYKMSLKYMLTKAPESKYSLQVSVRHNNTKNSEWYTLNPEMQYVAGLTYADNLGGTIAADTPLNTWYTLEGTFTTKDISELYVAVSTTWEGNDDRYDTEGEIWIDNIVLQEVVELEYGKTGDLNDDAEIDIRDLVILKKMSAGVIAATWAADIDKNYTAADASDLASLRSLILGCNSVPLTLGDKTLIWNDEFDSYGLDNSKWGFTDYIMNNGEAVYQNISENTDVNSGILKMKVNKVGNNKFTLSNAVTTAGKFHFRYGYIEMRAKMPFSTGAFPAFWMKSDCYDQSENAYGEIDVAECYADTVHTQLHTWRRTAGAETYVNDRPHSSEVPNYKFMTEEAKNEWHTYGLDWTPDEMKFYVDGNLIGTVVHSDELFDEYYYLILTNEIFTETLIQQNWANVEGVRALTYNDSMPQMLVDYIRVYQDANMVS